MAVVISGSALASLFFELINSPGDQEGFLIGQVHKRTTDTISDSQITNVKEETVIAIQSHMPCLGLFSFYSSAGALNFQNLVELLGEKIKGVVGWYRFRRNTTPSITLRERALHFHLQDAFPTITSQHFLFMLSGGSLSTNSALHNFDHVIMHTVERSFQPLPMSVVNLGDTSHVEYKLYNTLATSSDCGMFGSLVNDFEKLFVEPGGQVGQISKVQEMKASVQEHIQVLSQDVMETEQHLQSLHQEVEVLRERLRHQESKDSTNTSKVPKTKNKPLPPEPEPEPEPEPVVENLLVFEEEPCKLKSNAKSSSSLKTDPVSEKPNILLNLSENTQEQEKESSSIYSSSSTTKADFDIAFIDEDVDDSSNPTHLNGDVNDQKEPQNSTASDLASIEVIAATAQVNNNDAQEVGDATQEENDESVDKIENEISGKPTEPFSFVQDILAEAKRPRRTAAIKNSKTSSQNQPGRKMAVSSETTDGKDVGMKPANSVPTDSHGESSFDGKTNKRSALKLQTTTRQRTRMAAKADATTSYEGTDGGQ